MSIDIEKISKFTLPELIRIAYEGDEDLLNKFHVDKFDINGAVASTLWMIEQTDEREYEEMDHYKVSLDGTPIGYVSLFPNFLYSFGININYRTKEILTEWWAKVKEIFGGKFITMLYPNNERAIEFCKKQGMVEVPDIEDNCVTLLNL